MQIELPIPPSVNHLYGRRGWKTYITNKGQAWFEEAGWKLKSQWKEPIITVPLKIEVLLYYCRRYDYDNCLKATNDLLTKMGVIEDDSLICEAHIYKVKVDHKPQEKLIIKIEKL